MNDRNARQPNVTFRCLSPDAKGALEAAAAEQGQSVSEFIRAAVATHMAFLNAESGGGGVATSRSSRRPHPPDRRERQHQRNQHGT